MTSSLSMPENRYYIAEDLSGELVLGGAEYHHLKNVMRKKEGDTVELINGRGALATAEVLSLGKREGNLNVLSYQEEIPSKYSLVLRQAYPRRKRLDMIIEKATELGVDRIQLFPGDLSEKGERGVERLEGVAHSAMKQCGRLFAPSIEIIDSIVAWSDLASPTYFGDVSPDAPLFQQLWKPDQTQVFCVGPESGFSEREIVHLKKLGALAVKLHSLILRTDTAPIVALSLMSHWLMNVETMPN